MKEIFVSVLFSYAVSSFADNYRQLCELYWSTGRIV